MSTDTFEAELAATLSARAASIRPGAFDRLDHEAIHAPTRRARLGITGGCVAAAGATAVTAVLLLGSASPAYAGWTARPSRAAHAPSHSAASSCSGQLAAQPSGLPAHGTWRVVLADVRGPFTAALYQSGSTYAVCLTSSSFTEIDRLTSDGRTGVSASPTSAGADASQTNTAVHMLTTASGSLSDVAQNQFTATGNGPYTLVDGLVASGVTGVTIDPSSGLNVAATVADGWFMAWWPGDATASAAQITMASGTTTEPLTPMEHPTPPTSGSMPTTCPVGQSPQRNAVVRSLGGPSSCGSR